MHELVTRVLSGPSDPGLVREVGVAAARLAGSGSPHAASARWLALLAEAYPGDTGVLCSVLLQHVELAPGEALAVPAGTLHAYLDGTCVELMGGSDNVLRGGLTPKHVDVDELLALLDPGVGPVPVLRAAPSTLAGERVYPTSTPDFRLAVLHPVEPVALDDRGPQVLLAVDGEVTVAVDGRQERLVPGEAVFVEAAARGVTVCGGGSLYRATPGPA